MLSAGNIMRQSSKVVRFLCFVTKGSAALHRFLFVSACCVSHNRKPVGDCVCQLLRRQTPPAKDHCGRLRADVHRDVHHCSASLHHWTVSGKASGASSGWVSGSLPLPLPLPPLCAAMSLRPPYVGWSTPQSTHRPARRQTRLAMIRWPKCLTKVRTSMGQNVRRALSASGRWRDASCRVWRWVQPVHVDLRAAGERPAWDWRDARPAPRHLLHRWFRHRGKCGPVCRYGNRVSGRLDVSQHQWVACTTQLIKYKSRAPLSLQTSGEWNNASGGVTLIEYRKLTTDRVVFETGKK